MQCGDEWAGDHAGSPGVALGRNVPVRPVSRKRARDEVPAAGAGCRARGV